MQANTDQTTDLDVLMSGPGLNPDKGESSQPASLATPAAGAHDRKRKLLPVPITQGGKEDSSKAQRLLQDVPKPMIPDTPPIDEWQQWREVHARNHNSCATSFPRSL